MYKITDAMYTSCMGRLDLIFQKSLSIRDVAGLSVVSANSQLVCSFSNIRGFFSLCTMMAVTEYKHANFRQAITVVQPLTALASSALYIIQSTDTDHLKDSVTNPPLPQTTRQTESKLT